LVAQVRATITAQSLDDFRTIPERFRASVLTALLGRLTPDRMEAMANRTDEAFITWFSSGISLAAVLTAVDTISDGAHLLGITCDLLTKPPEERPGAAEMGLNALAMLPFLSMGMIHSGDDILRSTRAVSEAAGTAADTGYYARMYDEVAELTSHIGDVPVEEVQAVAERLGLVDGNSSLLAATLRVSEAARLSPPRLLAVDDDLLMTETGLRGLLFPAETIHDEVIRILDRAPALRESLIPLNPAERLALILQGRSDLLNSVKFLEGGDSVDFMATSGRIADQIQFSARPGTVRLLPVESLPSSTWTDPLRLQGPSPGTAPQI
jgi:hypothetical protein